MAGYAWKITRDLFAEEFEDETSAVGTVGPRGAHPRWVDQLDSRGAGDNRSFRLRDDDGNVMAEGKYAGPEDERMFGPLYDFGAPNWGCTEIQYRSRKGWETL